MASLPDPTTAAFVIVDMQNDFVHPDGAYGRAGKTAAAIAALPARHRKLAKAMRAAGGWIVSTHFTLVPGRDGEPFISPHLKRMRPFLARGDFDIAVTCGRHGWRDAKGHPSCVGADCRRLCHHVCEGVHILDPVVGRHDEKNIFWPAC